MIAAVLASAWTLAACSPTFNWREVRAEPTALKAMLPCKPDKGARNVPMAGREVSLQVIGCDTGGATFAVMFADLGDAGRAGEALAQWKAASLSNMRSISSGENPFRPAGALALPQSVQVMAKGQRADGTKVESQAAYFAQGSHVFQAVIYAGQLKPEVAEPFFSGLRFQ
jgi:hypothetical protein